MITREEWEFVPTYGQWLYIPDGTILRGKKLALWYGYLQWRIKMEGTPKVEGMIEKAEYVFLKETYPFTYNMNSFIFYPDFKITYCGIFQPEHHSFMKIRGGYGKIIRRLYYQYPFLCIRVIEPIEYKTIMNNIKDEIDLEDKVCRSEE